MLTLLAPQPESLWDESLPGSRAAWWRTYWRRLAGRASVVSN